MNRQRLAFTLIEMLTVIFVIIILLALMVPVVQRIRETAARTQCANHLKQLAFGVLGYVDKHGKLPPTRYDPRLTWAVYILPHIGEDAAYKRFDLSKPYKDQTDAARQTQLSVFFCTTRRSPGQLSISGDVSHAAGGPHRPGGLGDYAASAGSTQNIAGQATSGDYWWSHSGHPDSRYRSPPSNGVFVMENDFTGHRKPRPFTLDDILDGVSNTIFLGEKHVTLNAFGTGTLDNCQWNGDTTSAFRRAGPGAPLERTLTSTAQRFGSYHPGLCQFVFGDGAVRAIATHIDTTTLGYMVDKADGQSFDSSKY